MKSHELTPSKLRERMYWWAQRYLSFRLRSKKEMVDYLIQKADKYLPDRDNQELVDDIIHQLVDETAIDDWKFVDWWVGERMYFKPRSKKLLTIELLQKGVKRDLIDQYFNENTIDDVASAKIIARKKLSKLGPKKTIEFLQRKGFGFHISKEVVEEIEKNDYNTF